jgi:hypothetical protein
VRDALHFIGGLMLLAGCAGTPAKESTSGQSAATGSNSPIVVATPGVAQDMTKSGTPFPAVPAGYRGLGGVFTPAGTRVIVAADTSAPVDKHDVHVGLLHGIAVAGYSENSTTVRLADCHGAGDTPQSAIKVEGLKDPTVEEGAAGIACSRLLHPGTHWLMSQGIAGDNGYLSQVVLGDGNGTLVVVYTDMNRMANQLIQELGD